MDKSAAAENDDLGALRAAADAAVRPYARESYDRLGATPGRALMGEFRSLATPERIRDLCDELEELRRDVQAMQDERAMSEPTSAASRPEQWVKPADPVTVRGECGHTFGVDRAEYGDGSVFCGGCGEVVVYGGCLTCGSLDCQSQGGPTLAHA